MDQLHLFMVLIGAVSPGRNTEQHDIFFGIAPSMKALVPHIVSFWRGSVLHIDGWRQVRWVDQYEINIVERREFQDNRPQLFFLNLGGYKHGEFEEFHYRLLVAAADKSKAIREARKSAFYKHVGFNGAPSHIDDKFGVDVDDVYRINDILPSTMKEQYAIQLLPASIHSIDEIHLGYFKLNHWDDE